MLVVHQLQISTMFFSSCIILHLPEHYEALAYLAIGGCFAFPTSTNLSSVSVCYLSRVCRDLLLPYIVHTSSMDRAANMWCPFYCACATIAGSGWLFVKPYWCALTLCTLPRPEMHRSDVGMVWLIAYHTIDGKPPPAFGERHAGAFVRAKSLRAQASGRWYASKWPSVCESLI